jgi:hypothetical protein
MQAPVDIPSNDRVQARGDALALARHHLLHEPALLLSLAYIAVSALGLWASYWLYHPFGIPVFEYMQPSDILIAGLRDPVYLLLVAAAFGIAALARRWGNWRFDHPDRVERMRSHWFGRLWSPRWRERMNTNPVARTMFASAFVIYLVFSLVLWYTQNETARLLRGEGQQVILIYAGAPTPQAEPALLIGTTADWVFVYWPRRHQAEAIAQQSLRSLVYPAVIASAMPPK